MKKLSTTALLILLACLAASAQFCLPNGIRFTTQGQVDSFAMHYPGCHSMGGDLVIDTTAISSLAGLSVLDSIEGGLHLQNNPLLTSLQGLHNLVSVGGTIYISNNDALDSLTGLGNLNLLGGSLIIEENLLLKNLAGLGSLTGIGGEFSVINNPVLNNLAGLSQLHSIGARMQLQDNPQLSGFSGLAGLHAIAGNLTVTSCAAIQDFDGLQGISAVVGGLAVTNCATLQSFNGLQNVGTIAGDLTVNDTIGGVQAFTGLDNVTHIGGSMTVNSQAYQDFTGLDHLAAITGSLSIGGVSLNSLTGLGALVSVGGSFSLGHTLTLTDFTGLTHLTAIGGNLYVGATTGLHDFTGLEAITTLKALSVAGNASLESFTGLNNLGTLKNGLTVTNNAVLPNLQGLNNLSTIGSTLDGSLFPFQDVSINIKNNPLLVNFSGLEHVQHLSKNLSVQHNASLEDFTGLSGLRFIGKDIFVFNNQGLQSMSGLENLDTLLGDFNIQNATLQQIGNFPHLKAIGGDLNLVNNYALTSLSGLDSLHTVGGDALVEWCSTLHDLNGLGRLESIGGYLSIDINGSLTTLAGLNSLQQVDGLDIFQNLSLTTCNIYAVCNQIINHSGFQYIEDNHAGCNSVAEVEFACGALPVLATVRVDLNLDCQPDSTDALAEGVVVKLTSSLQQVIRPTQGDGLARFGYIDTSAFSLTLPQFPTANWAVCQDTFWFQSDTIQDTLRTTFLLQPLNQCPDLAVDLWLPPFFRGCLATSNVQAVVRNSGTITAEDVQLAVLLPPGLDLVSSVPPLTSQNGDTLFFNLGDLPPFVAGTVNMVVRTSCDSFLLGQTLCLEAFSSLSNPCQLNQPAFSEIRLFSQCLSDTTLRFTLKNVGEVATQGLHDYVIIEDELILMQSHFNLNGLASMSVDVPAQGATYRMEATKYDDGTLTAVARENCGGLHPGLITAYWLNDGRQNYDFDCRQVVLAYDPNLKSAIPTGVGPEHLLAANRPIQYTIDFQNTGTDTAFRVLIRDVLPPQLDPLSFRPGYASQPYTWEILGGDTLEVLFSPIMLPDSLVNEAASHGRFSFDIDQRPDLPDGSHIENTAAIIFDYNPPIVTNTVWHTIGKLTVSVDEPRAPDQTWQVMSNPARYTATFRSKTFIPGMKRFELTDAQGRLVRTEHFEGQEFEFQRGQLLRGLYYFRIYDAQGKAAAGKIVLSE